jgi:two-component system sensor histidine kinase CpxA
VRRLFLRIFLAFWVAMAAMAAVLIVSSPFFTRARPGVERWQKGAERALEERLAEGVAQVRGDSAPREPMSHRRGRPPAALHVLSEEGIAVDGPDAPPEVAGFARRVAAAGEEVSEREGALHMVGRPATTPSGERVVIVAAVRRPPRLVDLLEPRVLGWRVALLTAVVGVLCYWLARTLTAPVTALRGAVGRLAGGDLGARAEPSIARRRDEIGDLARDFDSMATRVESLVGSQRRLVRDVSHELRSPLARLQVALELTRGEVGEVAHAHLDRIGLEAGRLDALVEQLLTLSRLEVSDTMSVRDAVDLVELAEQVAEDAAFEASGRGVAVAVDAGDGQVTVAGDPSSLASALENVLRNAIHHTAAGSTVGVAVRRVGTDAEIKVADRGPGIPEEHLAHVFEPFFRVEEARERERGGAGLGLAIAARAVALHGGTITAHNRTGGGLEVVVLLPLGGLPLRPS